MKLLQKYYKKKLKDSAHKRQVKLVSTLLEPSILFHTLVRHVDSEDIANEKIRTNDLALEINKVSIEDDTNNKESEHDHIMVTQSGEPNNKSKPAYKHIVLGVTKRIMVFQVVIKNNAMKNIKDIKIRDQEFLNNALYNMFVVNLVIHRKIEMKTKMIILLEKTTVIDLIKTSTTTTTTDKEKIDSYRSNSRNYSQNNYRSNSRQRYYNRSPSPYPSRSRYDNHYQRRTPSRSPYRSPYINNFNYRYNSLSRYRSRSQSQGNSFRRYNYPYRSPSKPRDYRSRSKTPSQNTQQNRINQVDVKSTNDKDSTKFEIHTCQITEIANTITPYSWFYSLYVHAYNILPSKLEILFLLDTGASISVLNLPTFLVIAKQ